MLSWLGDWAEGGAWWVWVGLFLFIAGAESVWPARSLSIPMAARWVGHFVLYATCLALLALVGPSTRIYGLNANEGARFAFAALGMMGDWAVLVGGILLADLLIYALHRIEHWVFVLWRFHAVHHADTDLDVTTALRHHPVEFVLNSCVSAVVLLGLGAPSWLIPVYGLIFLSVSLLQHMNASLPGRLDRLLNLVLVTPGMHRVHHSVLPADHGANFGTVFSFWDRLFGTYRGLDRGQQEVLAYGISEFTAPHYARFHWAWAMPFALRREPRKDWVERPIVVPEDVRAERPRV